jgi:hypothetical protein
MPHVECTTEAEAWLGRCAQQLQALDPHLGIARAIELALDLHRAWPLLGPDEAAAAFTLPEQMAVPLPQSPALEI